MERLEEDPEYDYDDGDYLPMTPELLIPSAIGIGVLIVLAVIGNVVTIIAYITDKRLHTVYDTYIFNLAVTDLLIGCISMPFYAVYTLKDFTWIFGYHGCKAWLVVDFTVCLQTILLTLLLSVDRLLLITYGPQYTTKVTMKRTTVIITISWIVAFSLYGPFIIAWDHVTGYTTVVDMDCDVEFASNFEYTTTAAVIEFVVPVTALAVLNIIIYKKIKERLKINTHNSTERQNTYPVSTNKSIPNGRDSKSTVTSIPPINSQPKIRFDAFISDREKVTSSKHTTAIHNTDVKKINSRLRRDSRAARFLAILVIVFLICWAPYTITTIIISFCSECVNESAAEALNWLLWAKSAINPFMYALNSSRYRYNFRKYIFCWKKQNLLVHTETTMNTAA